MTNNMSFLTQPRLEVVRHLILRLTQVVNSAGYGQDVYFRTNLIICANLANSIRQLARVF